MGIIGRFLPCHGLLGAVIHSAGAVVDSAEEETQSALPYQQIATRDPILWSAAFILFEDELHDFGRVFCDCRVVGSQYHHDA